MNFLKKLKENRNKAENIELSSNRTGLRLAIALGFLAIGLAAIGIGLFSLLNEDPGWKKIEMSESYPAVEEELVFNYCLGSSGASATAEYKKISELYSTVGAKAYQAFHSTEEFEGISNLCTLSRNINKETEVDPLLYNALKLLSEEGSRLHYLGPVYREYEALCVSGSEEYAAMRDPYLDEETKAYFQSIIAFISDPDMVSIELLGDNKAILHVSSEYLRFAEQNGIETYVDFYWFRNAFVVDAIADSFIENGYTYGNITSYDGFTRNLDNSGNSYGINFFDRNGSVINSAAIVSYSGASSFAVFRDYPMSEGDSFRYFSYSDGRIVTPYVDPSDGICKSGVQDLLVASKSNSCAVLAVRTFPYFIQDTLDASDISSLKSNEIAAVWNVNDTVFYSSDEFAASPSSGEGNMIYKTEKQ